jgi:hypothetical protein
MVAVLENTTAAWKGAPMAGRWAESTAAWMVVATDDSMADTWACSTAATTVYW